MAGGPLPVGQQPGSDKTEYRRDDKCRNSNAMKNHYLLTQISDIVMQLYLAWNPYIRELGQTMKNTSSWLLESFRGLTVTEEDVSNIFRYTTVYLE